MVSKKKSINLSISDISNKLEKAKEMIGKIVVGQEIIVENVLLSMICDGHILLEGAPGLAKTLLVRTLADVFDLEFSRVQFTPDLMPSDITGVSVYQPNDGTFKFNKGPIFTNLLLADEINRAPPKTQAALLEAMQEKQITIEGTTHKLASPFIVLATQNPIEYEGTYPLPEAQMDRFLIKLSVGYPDEDVETGILEGRSQRKKDSFTVKSRATPEKVVEMHDSIEEVFVKKEVMRYIVDLVQSTRRDPRVAVGSSPRGSLGLFKLSRALAVLSGRDYVVPDDVKRAAIPVLGHRIILKPEARIRGVNVEEVIGELLMTVQVPAVTVE